MTRRRAALLAAVVAVLLGATYLLTRRGQSAPELVPSTPPVPPVPPSPREVAEAEAEPTTEALPIADAAPVVPVRSKRSERRSWDAARPLPAPPVAAPAVMPATAVADAEQPLPTWVRLAIVAAALVAFFAVSLIATKQV